MSVFKLCFVESHSLFSDLTSQPLHMTILPVLLYFYDLAVSPLWPQPRALPLSIFLLWPQVKAIHSHLASFPTRTMVFVASLANLVHLCRRSLRRDLEPYVLPSQRLSIFYCVFPGSSGSGISTPSAGKSVHTGIPS